MKFSRVCIYYITGVASQVYSKKSIREANLLYLDRSADVRNQLITLLKSTF